MSDPSDNISRPRIDPDVSITWGKFVISMTRALSDKALRWASMGLAGGITIGAMVRPDPVRAGIAVFLVGLLSPLWLRRERPDGS